MQQIEIGNKLIIYRHKNGTEMSYPDRKLVKEAIQQGQTSGKLSDGGFWEVGI